MPVVKWRLWKSYAFQKSACGKKTVAALSKIGLIHINSYYGYDYCIYPDKYKYLYIMNRKEIRHAFYL